MSKVPKGHSTHERISERSAKANHRIVGSAGYKVLAAGAYTNLNVECIVVLAAGTVFTAYTEGGVNMLTERGLDVAEIPANLYAPAPDGVAIDTITFTGGPIQVFHKSS